MQRGVAAEHVEASRRRAARRGSRRIWIVPIPPFASWRTSAAASSMSPRSSPALCGQHDARGSRLHGDDLAADRALGGRSGDSPARAVCRRPGRGRETTACSWSARVAIPISSPSPASTPRQVSSASTARHWSRSRRPPGAAGRSRTIARASSRPRAIGLLEVGVDPLLQRGDRDLPMRPAVRQTNTGVRRLAIDERPPVGVDGGEPASARARCASRSHTPTSSTPTVPRSRATWSVRDQPAIIPTRMRCSSVDGCQGPARSRARSVAL